MLRLHLVALVLTVLAGGYVQAAALHSSGYALRPWNRAAEFNMPILIMHGTALRTEHTVRLRA